MDNKGQGISMTFIVIAALALIVLIVIVLFFTGGMERLIGEQTSAVTGGIPESKKAIWTARCKTACTLGNTDDFCETAFDYRDEDGEILYVICNSELYEGDKEIEDELGIACPDMTCPS